MVLLAGRRLDSTGGASSDARIIKSALILKDGIEPRSRYALDAGNAQSKLAPCGILPAARRCEVCAPAAFDSKDRGYAIERNGSCVD